MYFLDDDESLMLSVTGLGSDASALVDMSKQFVRDYRASFGCTVDSAKTLATNLADILHSQTRHSGSRPLAVAAAIAGFDEANKPQQH